MAIKMRILYASSKKKISNIANAIKSQYDLAFNSVDVIPPAYSCDKERIVVLAVSAKGDISDSLRLFCRELTKARAQNVALMIDGDDKAAAKLKETLTDRRGSLRKGRTPHYRRFGEARGKGRDLCLG